MRDKRVIVVDGINGKWYEQAIFIVKPGFDAPVDLVCEAEKIIGEYISRQTPQKCSAASEVAATSELPRIPARDIILSQRITPKKPGKAIDIVLNAIMLLCAVTLAGLLAYAFWG